jgi:carbamoyltransferase
VYNILGLNFGHDGAAAIVRDGRLVCAIANERLSRTKKAIGVTAEMIDYVLGAAGLTLDDIDGVAFASFRYRPDSFVKVLDPQGVEVTSDDRMRQLRARLTVKQQTIELSVDIEGRRFKAVFVQHHLAHAASAYYTSPFDRAACFTMDASHFPPEDCSLFAYGEGNQLHYHSCPGLMIGNAYSEFTEKLGLGSGLTKAGTTMALASFGQPLPLAVERWQYYGQSCYARRGVQPSDKVFINLMWSELSGLPPHAVFPPEQSDSQAAMDIAASLEYIFEETIVRHANALHASTRAYHGDNLCLSGGSFLNSNANMRVRRESPFARLHLFPGCGDDGTAVGAALYLAHHVLGAPRVNYEPREYMYTGRSYAFTGPGGEPYDSRIVAQALSEGQIVAFFHGGSEFGPRALGHRSLLADPRHPQMKDILNRRIKHREWFRPFAPIVLEEKAADWFDVDFASKLMLFIAPIREPERLPAVAHVDGSARLQTMTRDDNPRVHELISNFEAITGVPVILNTSLNDNGEPLVEAPEDALRFFRTHDVDMLVLDDHMFRRHASAVMPAAVGHSATAP